MSHLMDPHELKYKHGQFRSNDDRDYMKLLTCHYTDRQIRFMNYLVEKGYYANRSELLRNALGFLTEFYGDIWLQLNGSEIEP